MEDETKRILAHISCRVILQQFKNLALAVVERTYINSALG